MANTRKKERAPQFHPRAKALLRRILSRDEKAIVVLSKILAKLRHEGLILPVDVRDAYHSLLQKGPKRSLWKRVTSAFGWALIGAFIQGFILELSSGRVLWMAVYTIIGFVGTALVFWGWVSADG